MPLDRVLETSLYVRDLEEAKAFYGGTLGLALHAEQSGRHVFFRCGESMVLLFQPDATEQPDASGIPVHGARGAGHLAWAVRASELPGWRLRLQAAGVAIEAEHAWPNGGHSLYFRDPAGNSLEFATPQVWGLASP